jgi:hypothetical protein
MFSTGENSNSEMLPLVATIDLASYQSFNGKNKPEGAVAVSATGPQRVQYGHLDDTSLKAIRHRFIRLWATIQRQGLEKAAHNSFQSGNSAAQYLAWFLAGQLTAWTDESLTELNVREAWRVARVLYTDMLQHA